MLQDALRDLLTESQLTGALPLFDLHFGKNRMVNPAYAGGRSATELAKKSIGSTPGVCLKDMCCYRERGGRLAAG